MAAQKCLHEERWEQMIQKMNEYHAKLYGNGKDGIIESVIKLNNRVDILTNMAEKQGKVLDLILEKTEAYRTVISAIEKTQENFETRWTSEKEKEKRKTDLRLSRASIILYALMVIFTAANVIRIFQENKNPNPEIPKIEWYRGK